MKKPAALVSLALLALLAFTAGRYTARPNHDNRSEEHTSELQSQSNLVCRLLLEKKKNQAELQSKSKLASFFLSARTQHSQPVRHSRILTYSDLYGTRRGLCANSYQGV